MIVLLIAAFIMALTVLVLMFVNLVINNRKIFFVMSGLCALAAIAFQVCLSSVWLTALWVFCGLWWFITAMATKPNKKGEEK